MPKPNFENLSNLSDNALSAIVTEARAELAAIFDAVPEGAVPTAEQYTDVEALDAGLTATTAELAGRAERAAAFAARRASFSAPEAENQAEAPEEEAPAEEPESEGEAPAEGEETPEAEAPAETPEPAPAAPVTPTSTEASMTTPGLRPSTPPPASAPARRAQMFAAQDVPGIRTGGEFNTVEEMGDKLSEIFGQMPEPSGTGGPADIRKFGFASIRKNIPDELKITDAMSLRQVMAVIDRAVDESALPGGNLVASAGWCAPSEVVYDLCEGETTDGLLSLPEVGISRGGLKYTMGPDWSDIYGNGEFAMTEAQAIAGSYTKPSYEIPCPTFQDVRLNAAGLFVKIPFLLEAGYPELVQRWMRGIMTAHQHVMNVKFITAIQTALGAATAFPLLDMGSAAVSLFDIISLIAERERAKRKWAFNQSLEIVLPHWVLEVLRSDIANRANRASLSVPDSEIAALFAERKYAPQWIYDYAELGASAVAYPTTFEVLIYKAGTFVKGTSDVVNLQSVYDAASLAGNVYTGLFMEEGWDIMQMCYGGVRATIPLSIAGQSGPFMTGTALVTGHA